MMTDIAPVGEKAIGRGLLDAPVHLDTTDWWRNFRTNGWETFSQLPMPTRTDESWRFANIKALELSSYGSPQPVSDDAQNELSERSVSLPKSAGRMVFANDQLIAREVFSDVLRSKGVIFEPIETAAVEHQDIFRKHFMAQEAALGSRKFAALHKAWVKAGTFLVIPRNVEVEFPIEIFHWLDGDGGSTFPHTLLIAGENSKVTLIDYFQSARPDAAGFSCGVSDFYLGAGAKLNYINVQDWSRETAAVQINSTIVGRDASASILTMNLGAKYGRGESVSRLVGSGGRSDMLSVSIGDHAQEFDQRTLQDHQEPDTASDLLYKNSLDGKARTIFAGLIRVEPHAHRTDAYQKVRNLLLSDDAEANSMPGLEIMADEVRCTHGATSGQIDEEQLFYMLSRGISRERAQKLIVFGFLNEVISRVGNAAVEEKLRELVLEKFGGG